MAVAKKKQDKSKKTSSEAKTKQKKNKSSRGVVEFLRDEKTKSAVGVVLMLATVYVVLSLVSFLIYGANDQSFVLASGEVGEQQKDVINGWTGEKGAKLAEMMINRGFGIAIISLFVFPFVLSLRLFSVKIKSMWKYLIYPLVFVAWGAVALDFCFSGLLADSFLSIGGEYGEYVNGLLQSNVGWPGTLLTLLATGLTISIFAFQSTIPFLRNVFGKIRLPKKQTKVDEVENDDRNVRVGDDIVPEEWVTQDGDETETEEIDIETIELDSEDGNDKNSGIEIETVDVEDEIIETEDVVTDTVIPEDGEIVEENIEPYDPKLDLSNYKYPTLELLKEYPAQKQVMTREEQMANQTKIITTLKNFGIGVKKIFETIGPTITLYEIVPEDGVRITKIKNLEADIMLSLAAIGIRIIAPMPGKGTIGIEVPNSNPKVVSMFATIASKKFQESDYELPVVLGRTITNDIFMFDLAKMPHLLVAGATGQGKSVGLNAIITSLLYKKHPSELKFVLIDPKKVEFNIYADIEKHFLAALPDSEEPVITDTSLVVQTLNSLCKEMDERYDLLKAAKTRNIKEYNSKFISRRLNPLKGHRYLPYIVVIVDEFGDLIMTAGKEVELPIARIAQLARAVGIHMIIATQRPSVNIITGIIKANFPARIAFKVSAAVDSKTILDGSGADRLIGRGDMLFTKGNEPERVQCAFVDTPEVENIVNFIAEQQGYSTVFELPEADIDGDGNDLSGVDMTKKDPYFEDVAKYVVTSQMGSTSNIQRKYEIGFNRAGRIMDQLEVAGIVGAAKGSKPREVLIQSEVDLEFILKSYR